MKYRHDHVYNKVVPKVEGYNTRRSIYGCVIYTKYNIYIIIVYTSASASTGRSVPIAYPIRAFNLCVARGVA